MGFLTESKSESVFREGLRVFQGFGSDQEIGREGLVFGFYENRRGLVWFRSKVLWDGKAVQRWSDGV